MPKLNFSVDSALLAELGERLVGKAYIALAELVKNSYDADSFEVKIELFPDKNTIIISDKGHGMTLTEFKKFWMRVGSIHKKKQKTSRNLKRPLTGSKGIGRLAVQYLAHEIEISTVSEKDTTKKMKAHLNWKDAVEAGDLTNAEINYEIENNGPYEEGTIIQLNNLKQNWDAKQIQGLAREVWWLEQPFKDRTKKLIKKENRKPEDFDIIFESSKEYEEIFETQINAIMNIWNARIKGKNNNGKVIFTLEYAGETPETEEFKVENCKLQNGSFEIRIYHLQHRQPHGIKVGEARDYLNNYGGVYVYDAGFQLPYYGNPKNDWLKIEFDHSHRLTTSKLLPKKYQIKGGLQFLPTLSRILGVVNVNTSEEEDLDILITRDRLQNSTALTNLENIVRYALDYYAYIERVRREEELQRTEKVLMPKSQRIEEVFDKYEGIVNKQDLDKIEEEVKEVINNYESEAEIIANKINFIGPLATAGITNVAIQHETKWQIKSLDVILDKIEQIDSNVKDIKLRNQLVELKSELENWATRVKQQQSLLSYFNDIENIETKKRMIARNVIEDIIRQVKTLSENVKYDLSELEYQLLPKASIVEWASIFQNVLINAFNALVDTNNKKIKISIESIDRDRVILIQDNGVGIDLNEAELFFDPFKRKIVISEERQGLGYGGMGLGLSIVRMIATNIGCSVGFQEPETGYSTAFFLKWRERK